MIIGMATLTAMTQAINAYVIWLVGISINKDVTFISFFSELLHLRVLYIWYRSRLYV